MYFFHLVPNITLVLKRSSHWLCWSHTHTHTRTHTHTCTYPSGTFNTHFSFTCF
ncbi:hypothetical protein K492DRAFT_77863 [Lichtheimia hyalospora FSU 10163]|nr:hypothetical protein K492DRAFT_77863 [Lichtheimia hyalospora FSU 10163]